MNSADTVHRAAGRVLHSLTFAACMAASSPPPAQVKDRHTPLHSLSLPSPSFSCSLSKPAPRHCCWGSIATIAERQSSSATVPIASVLRLLGPRPAYLHHQAHVVCLSFERRALPYMAAAISACTNAMAKLAQVTMVVMCPLASHVGSLWNVRTPLAPPFAAGAASAGRSHEPGRSLLYHRKDEDEGRRAQIREKVGV